MVKQTQLSDGRIVMSGSSLIKTEEEVPRLGEKEIKKKLEELKKDIDSFKKEQNIKLVEFLGIFTAILAFITISSKIVIDNFGAIQILILLPTFALVLILFVVSIDFLISKENKFAFWVMFGLLIVFDFFVIRYALIAGWLT